MKKNIQSISNEFFNKYNDITPNYYYFAKFKFKLLNIDITRVNILTFM